MICRCLASRNVGIQLGLILLCLAVVTAFGAVLTGTSSATTRDSATQANRLLVDPASGQTGTTVRVGKGQGYPAGPSLDRPDPATANRTVMVGGSTGSCGRQGTLTVHEVTTADKKFDVSVDVTANQGKGGGFQVALLVPRGAFPWTYQMTLTVDCKGDTQQAEGQLRVVNHAPVAVDDSASTIRGKPVVIAVTANDFDPDGDDGYRGSVRLEGPPVSGGKASVQDDGTILYDPAEASDRDSFQYGYCDDLIDADGRGVSECGTATVTVKIGLY